MRRILERFLLFWLVGGSLLAYFWPKILDGLHLPFAVPDPFLASKPYLSTLIAVTMFAVGWMLPRDEIRQVLRRWPTVLGGTAVQYVAMPALAYLFGHAFGLKGDVLIGVVLVGCVPGAMASNVLTLLARGNTSYSVSLTTSATLLSPLVVPLTLKLTLGMHEGVDQAFLLRTSLFLLITVVAPVIVGHLLCRRFPRYAGTAQNVGSTVANLSILWIIIVVVGVNRERLQHVDPRMAVALLGINVCGYLAGYGGGSAMRLPGAMRRALTLEVGMQNAGLGATLALQLFPGRDSTAIAPALYTFGCMLTGTILARFWAGRRFASAEDCSAEESSADDADGHK